MDKISLGVVFGGNSSEYEISLLSASSVLKNINRERYNIYMIGITRQGKMFLYNDVIEKIQENTWFEGNCQECVISPDPSHHGIIVLSENPAKIIRLDCIFPVLHGKNGEDGTMQGLLQLSQIPFVGCDSLSSAMCMDKDITHTILTNVNIKNAKWISILNCDYKENQDEYIEKLETQLGYPMFVKPANAGSSVGISKSTNKQSLNEAIELAFEHDKKVIVEEMLYGIEVECAVLGNEDPKASIPAEIAPCNDFYDYEAKYLANESKTYIPARISEKLSDELRQSAIKAYKALGCSGMSRVDFFVTNDDQIILNEINTIPGFTAISMYPQMWTETGLPYSLLIDALIELALERD